MIIRGGRMNKVYFVNSNLNLIFFYLFFNVDEEE